MSAREPTPRRRRRRRRARLPHARRVGAARGDLDRLAAQPRDWPGKFGADPLGLRRDRAPPGRRRARPHPGQRRRRREARAPSVLDAVGVDSDAGRVLPRARPTASGRATTGPIFVDATRDGDVGRRPTGGSTAGRSTPNWQARRRGAAPAGAALELRRGSRPRRSAGARARRARRRRIDVNGAGTLLTTEECLLERRCRRATPASAARSCEARACATYLGVRKVLWLGRGIAGDDTHGHVDDLARFVDRDDGRRSSQETDPRRRQLRAAAREPRAPRAA